MSTIAELPKLSRSEQARVNGAKSQGPKTPEGKAVSSRNGVKHGFYSIDVFLEGESEEEFHDLRDAHLRSFRPLDETEIVMVGRIAVADWRHRRVSRMLDRELASGDNYSEIFERWRRPQRDAARELKEAHRALHLHRQETRKMVQFLNADFIGQPPLVIPDLPPSPIEERSWFNPGCKVFLTNVDSVENDVFRKAQEDRIADDTWVPSFRNDNTNPSQIEIGPEKNQNPETTLMELASEQKPIAFNTPSMSPPADDPKPEPRGPWLDRIGKPSRF